VPTLCHVAAVLESVVAAGGGFAGISSRSLESKGNPIEVVMLRRPAAADFDREWAV
jgi:hypothetical protein